MKESMAAFLGSLRSFLYLGLQMTSGEINLMKRIKQAFDPKGILNPGKIFPAP